MAARANTADAWRITDGAEKKEELMCGLSCIGFEMATGACGEGCLEGKAASMYPFPRDPM